MKAWSLFLKYFAPILIFIVFLNSVGLIEQVKNYIFTLWFLLAILIVTILLRIRRKRA